MTAGKTLPVLTAQLGAQNACVPLSSDSPALLLFKQRPVSRVGTHSASGGAVTLIPTLRARPRAGRRRVKGLQLRSGEAAGSTERRSRGRSGKEAGAVSSPGAGRSILNVTRARVPRLPGRCGSVASQSPSSRPPSALSSQTKSPRAGPPSHCGSPLT